MNDRIPDAEKLRADLEAVFGETPEPSDELRAAVMDLARRRRVRPAAPRPRWRVPAAAATLVAAAALVILVTRPEAPVHVAQDRVAEAPAARAPAAKSVMRAAPMAGDLNGDGRIDIVDAWRLARSIDVGGDQGDLDADGEVSAGDLDRLMQRIVAVGGGAS